MLQRLISWFSNLGAHTDKQNELEPHVKRFRMDEHELDEVIFPYQLLNLILLSFLGIALFNTLVYDNMAATRAILWFCCILIFFHFPGVLCYQTYFKREQNTQVEIDEESSTIKYKNNGTNLLFHTEHIENCRLVKSGLFPSGIDYLTLTLKGGSQIAISNLIMRPEEILTDAPFPVEVEIRWLNPFPDTP